MPLGGLDPLTPAHLADKVGLRAQIVAADVSPIARGVKSLDRLLVNLRQQDVSDGLDHILRRAFQQIGEANVKHAFAQADGVVHVGEGIELDAELRDGRTRAQVSINAVQDVLEIRLQASRKVARVERWSLRRTAWVS